MPSAFEIRMENFIRARETLRDNELTWTTYPATVSSSTGTNASERDYSQGEVASPSPGVRLVPESEYARSTPRRDAQGRFASITQDPQTNVSPIPDKPGIKGWFSKLDRMAA